VEEFPWGERAIKVRGKIFVAMRQTPEGFTFTTKLPHSAGAALMFAYAQPTGYGLGKCGWVTASFGLRDTPPVPLLKAWIQESYQAVAPKKLAALGLPE
jgi:predicted DNA-binding protein (MmcQ/YjbR family)